MFKGNHLVISSSSVPTVAGAKHHHPLAPYLAHLETLQLEPAASKVDVQSKANGTWRPFASCLIDLAQQDDAKCVNMRTLRRSIPIHVYLRLHPLLHLHAFTTIQLNYIMHLFDVSVSRLLQSSSTNHSSIGSVSKNFRVLQVGR